MHSGRLEDGLSTSKQGLKLCIRVCLQSVYQPCIKFVLTVCETMYQYPSRMDVPDMSGKRDHGFLPVDIAPTGALLGTRGRDCTQSMTSSSRHPTAFLDSFRRAGNLPSRSRRHRVTRDRPVIVMTSAIRSIFTYALHFTARSPCSWNEDRGSEAGKREQ